VPTGAILGHGVKDMWFTNQDNTICFEWCFFGKATTQSIQERPHQPSSWTRHELSHDLGRHLSQKPLAKYVQNICSWDFHGNIWYSQLQCLQFHDEFCWNVLGNSTEKYQFQSLKWLILKFKMKHYCLFCLKCFLFFNYFIFFQMK